MAAVLTKYGVGWSYNDALRIELACIRKGGKWIQGGKTVGAGLEHHYTEAIKLLWPNFHWHRWTRLLLKSFVDGNEIAVNGPGASGKTTFAACFGLVTYCARPHGTSIMMSTTTRDGLQIRIWGAVKKWYNSAKLRHPWLPGYIIESRYMLTTDPPDDDEGREFKNGILGIACRVGGSFVGISNYVGLHNDVVYLIADEGSLMGRGFLDAVSNLRKNPVFKLIVMGNPKDHTDCLGVVSEPALEDGGWPGFEYIEKTRTWKTRANGGIAIQLCGYDSPNYDYPRGVNPYVGIITPEQIESDLAYYGKDSLQFSMMNLGLYPKDGGSRRVITRMLCEKNFAFEEVIWDGFNNVTVAGLDAAYSGTGGDRCVLTILRYGRDRTGKNLIAFVCPPIIVPTGIRKGNLTVEELIADFVAEKCAEFKVEPHRCGLDSTGRGSLVSALAQRWSPAVVAVEFGGRAPERLVAMEGDKRMERDAYGKMVTALWFASRAIIESGQMRGLPQDVMEEGTMREWGINRDGRTDVETKDKTKLRMGRSPDLWDSLVVAIEVARRTGFQIQNSSAAVLRPMMPANLLRLRDRFKSIEKSKQLSYAA